MRLSGAVLHVFLALSIALAWPGESALADKRIALVIGNSDYRNAGVLANPRNDAQAVGTALSALEFDVDTRLDLDRDTFIASLRRFGDRMEGATAAIFYYAGHGLQVNGANYLLPTDAKLLKEVHLDYEAVALSTVLRTMEGGGRVNIVFLDACRDNPLGRNLGSGGRSVVGRGLARVDASLGTLISFATAEGRIADDGKGRNSPYTAALVKHLQTPGLELSKVLLRVRQDVLQATNNQQVPWEYSSLTGEFYFNPQPTSQRPPSAPPPDPEELFWRTIMSSKVAADYETYLARFPVGRYEKLARSRLEAIISKPREMRPVKLLAPVYGSPSSSAFLVDMIDQGSTVIVISEINIGEGFYKVRLSDGEIGYVKRGDLEN